MISSLSDLICHSNFLLFSFYYKSYKIRKNKKTKNTKSTPTFYFLVYLFGVLLLLLLLFLFFANKLVDVLLISIFKFNQHQPSSIICKKKTSNKVYSNNVEKSYKNHKLWFTILLYNMDLFIILQVNKHFVFVANSIRYSRK